MRPRNRLLLPESVHPAQTLEKVVNLTGYSSWVTNYIPHTLAPALPPSLSALAPSLPHVSVFLTATPSLLSTHLPIQLSHLRSAFPFVLPSTAPVFPHHPATRPSASPPSLCLHSPAHLHPRIYHNSDTHALPQDARKSKQNANNPRRVIAKLGFTAQLVRTFSLKGSLGVDAIMTRKVVPALDSPNVDVRQAAILLAAEAQLRQPKAMKPHVENLKANAQTSIQEAAEHLRNNPPAPGRPVPDRASAPAPAPAPAPEPMHTVRTSPSPVQVLLRSKTQVGAFF